MAARARRGQRMMETERAGHNMAGSACVVRSREMAFLVVMNELNDLRGQ